MALNEASLLCPENVAEDLADALMDAGVMSVSTEDADADSPDEVPLYGEPGLEPTTQAWRNSRLKLLVDESFDIGKAVRDASESLGIEPPALESVTPVPDADWVRVTQAQFGPTQVSPRLWIVPSWSEPPVADALNIRLDPGVAFGTGSHPTTHLCLEWLDANTKAGDDVLDYGCGTGILAIAAAKLGAKDVWGTDIDPQAVEAAVYNARENGVDAHFVLPEGMPEEKKFKIVVANILANPLKLLAPALVGRVSAGGHLVLSGLLAHQTDEIIAVYKGFGIELTLYKEMNGWICLAGKRG